MSSTSVTLRCPACGTDLRLALAPAPPTQWFPCPHCGAPVPATVPRDPPPLYSWEVTPNLYPPLPVPRPPRWRSGPAAAVALAVVAVAAVALGGLLAVYGVQATHPATYTVSGSVERELPDGAVVPAAGARVVLTDDQNRSQSTSVSAQGTFDFTGVPAGGVSLNFSLAGYAPETLQTFASPVYNAGTTGLRVVLAPGSDANGTTVVLSVFPDLETFLASIGSGAVIMGIVALIAGLAAAATVRRDARAFGVVGGAAGTLAPVAIYLLGLTAVFPLAVVVVAIVAGFGAFALALRAMELAQTTPAPERD